VRAKKTLALIEISGVDYSLINFPDEFALEGEPFHVPAAIDPPIGTWLIQRNVPFAKTSCIEAEFKKRSLYLFCKARAQPCHLSFAGFKGEPQLGLLWQPLIPVTAK
jgi:hypothetical protein